MRRGITLPELILVLAILGVLTGIAVPRVQRLSDSLAVQQAALEIVSAHSRARMSAVLQSRVLELSIRADTLAIRVPGSPENLWHSPGPAAQGVALTGPTHALWFSPVGLTFGLSNGTYRLSRGSATRSVVVSRLGRVRIEP
jgi:prepilin-type N-terminal cleavage/methylation domain-containing protein